MPHSFTPGPWRLKSDPAHFDSLTAIEGGAVGVRKPFGVQMIVQVGGDADHVEAEANARLIAAAPDLLIVAKMAAAIGLHKLRDGESCKCIRCEMVHEARAAIAKATEAKPCP